ncbi:M23 family metallopeptidase [Clostridium sp. 'deep sea']|uniref:M23 family metallopeptidase n=1 Tax=Clostridium sp. 'deep sea' TaxID=2779445 RepID=UPI0018967B65|nr:M23 family metallopeptidase [Clostridium sp. 'deep sea']QOR36629.1 M23 family metallopeptidase [Clostridium sp. 'deep sea']
MESIIYPSKSRHIISKYGELQSNNNKCDGIKFNCALFSEVFAVADGTVVELSNETAYGKYLIIQHNEFCSIYANLNSIDVDIGFNVKQGDSVATTGVVSCISPPFLYFEIRIGHYNDKHFWHSTNSQFNNSVDPMRLLKKADDWRLSLGKKALENLHEKGIISEPERWQLSLLKSLPSWIIWEVFNRIVNRVGML